ncbi:MAG TPA: endonuclease MutS2 [Armatimonadota bacterium]|nr:endonuclease MutS2 [Armatimonadota bacterium]
MKVLEYDQVISMVRQRTACPLGDDLAQQLKPTADLLAITEGQRETSEAKAVIQEESNLPLGGIHDVRAQVTKASLDAMLNPSELLDAAETLASGRRLRAFIMKRADHYPKLAEIAASIGAFPRIEESINNCIAENGEIRDAASRELARIRSKLKTVHSRLLDQLDAMIHSPEFHTMIQEPVITQRADRYCIPVKSEHRRRLPGIVHDSSASGATLFIEPAAVVEMGNDLKELAAKEQQEIERILRRLSGLLKAAAQEIQITLAALARLDFASAKARLSCDMDATEPEVNHEGKLDIIKARHPLLKGEVVPIDVELGNRFKALLITGPNTGGKTVTLKTIGLLTLMAQSGLHIPANPGSEIAAFDEIFADIGDEQSIEQSLSTFSSHMTNIVNVTGRLARNSLVLLDEIGAGTDPAEGASLAKAILDYLIERDSRVAATTHYGELKEYAFIREGIENASVEFDVRTLQPTYRLMIGVPGSSNAFAIASRLGLPLQIIHSAEDMIRGGEASEEIIRKIEQTQRAVAEKEQLAERTSRDVETLKSRYEKRLEELEALRREMRQQLAEEVDRRVREKIEDLDQIVEELKKQPKAPQKKLQKGRERFKQRVKEIRQEVEELMPAPYEEPGEPFTLKAGDLVRLTTFGIDGELLNNPGEGDALVMVGSMKVSLPFDLLRPARRPERKTEPAATGGAVEIASSKVESISAELKLIAQRVEQALVNLDKYLDDAYLAGLPSVRIIHGRGTGALKKAVWEFLANHHAVESFRLGEQDEGGSGATIVKFEER